MPTDSISLELHSVRNDIGDIRTSVEKIADAMTRLAVLEERGGATIQLMEKIVDRLDKLEERYHQQELVLAAGKGEELRIEKLEGLVEDIQRADIARVASLRTARALAQGAWAIFGGALVYLLMRYFTNWPVPIPLPGVHE